MYLRSLTREQKIELAIPMVAAIIILACSVIALFFPDIMLPEWFLPNSASMGDRFLTIVAIVSLAFIWPSSKAFAAGLSYLSLYKTSRAYVFVLMAFVLLLAPVVFSAERAGLAISALLLIVSGAMLILYLLHRQKGKYVNKKEGSPYATRSWWAFLTGLLGVIIILVMSISLASDGAQVSSGVMGFIFSAIEMGIPVSVAFVITIFFHMRKYLETSSQEPLPFDKEPLTWAQFCAGAMPVILALFGLLLIILFYILMIIVLIMKIFTGEPLYPEGYVD